MRDISFIAAQPVVILIESVLPKGLGNLSSFQIPMPEEVKICCGSVAQGQIVVSVELVLYRTGLWVCPANHSNKSVHFTYTVFLKQKMWVILNTD